jgi:hypothetical protein
MVGRAAIVVVALVLVACPSATPPAGAQTAPLAAAQAVLDRRAEAVRSGDRASFAATIDPDASAAFRDAQLRSFDGLRSVPIQRYSLEARTDDTGDLGQPVAGGYGGAEVFLPETRQRYRLEGYDDRDAVDVLWLTFVRRGDRWYVGGDDDLEHLGLDTSRNLWDLGPVSVLRSTSFLVLHHPEDAARAEALAAIGEEAMGILGERWDQPWAKRIPMILPGDSDELEILLQSTVDLDKFVAFVGYGAVRDDSWEGTAPRIYIQDENLGGYGRPFQVETLVHELTHAAAASVAGPGIPSWVHEGVAEWEAAGQPMTPSRPPSDTLPHDHQFTTGSSTSIVAAYAASRSAIVALAARAGRTAPAALIAAMGAVKVAPGSDEHRTSAALQQVAGITLAEFTSSWQAAGKPA